MSNAQLDARLITITMDRLARGFGDKDKHEIARCYETDATYVHTPDRHVSGLCLGPLIEKVLREGREFEIAQREIVLADDLALHLSTYDEYIGDTVRKGISVAVLRRQGDGQWLVAIHHPAGHRMTCADSAGDD